MSIYTNMGEVSEPGAVEALLDELVRRHQGWLEASKRFAPYVAPGFSPFVLFAPGETMLSALIAHLLDPKGSHTQGDLFLRLFLEHLGYVDREAPRPDLRWPEPASRDALVTVERPARMDVFVEGHANRRGYRLAIENKLRGAEDQPRQIARYFEAIEGRAVLGDEACVVYLTVNGREPTEFSFPPNDRTPERTERLRCMTAEHLAEWLEDCRCRAKAPSVAAHVAAFRTHVVQDILGVRETEVVEIVEAITSDNEKTQAYFDAVAAQTAVRERLLERFMADLKMHLKAASLELDTSDRSGLWNAESDQGGQLLSIRPHAAGGSWAFVLEQGDKGLRFQNLTFGIKDEAGELEDRSAAVYGALRERYGSGDGLHEAYAGGDWVWWADATGNPDVFPIGSQGGGKAWAAMVDGALAKEVAAATKEVLSAADLLTESQ